MIRLITHIYDYLHTHKAICLSTLIVITSVLVLTLLNLNYKEDISDFLPVSGNEKEALSVYQDISGANKVFSIFEFNQPKDTKDSIVCNPDNTIEAIQAYSDFLEQNDTTGTVNSLTTQLDFEKFTGLIDFVYSNIPYFLTEKDYIRIDSLLSREDYIKEQLSNDKQMLMFPNSSFIVENIQRDPLNLFSPAVKSLQNNSVGDMFETYDGYIFTKDMQRAIVMMDSPFGNSETQNNSRLINLLNIAADSVQSQYPGYKVHHIGGPVIAVGNSMQIKTDSFISVSIAIILIFVLLLYAFRRIYSLFVIVLSIVWGWLFAMGMLALIHDSISLIVVGISSVILGIAVNYPLHLIAHLSHTPNIRQALQEIAAPLVIGNITTVGAFLALVPLDAVALRDLGLFSSFLLIGTILFVVLFLPHIINKKHDKTSGTTEHIPFRRLSNISAERKPIVLICLVVLTLIFGWFSLDTHFDPNMGNINYMTESQKRDMKYFQQLTSGTDSTIQCVYVVSKGTNLDEALSNSLSIQENLLSFVSGNNEKLISCTRYLCSKDEQERRLLQWEKFILDNKEKLVSRFSEACLNEGFQLEAFKTYFKTLETNYSQRDFHFFTPLSDIYNQHLSIDSLSGKYRVIDKLMVHTSKVTDIENQIKQLNNSCFSFDIQSMNSALANSLSENFNYIGWACGLIVFFFLWFSFGNIELALLSFLPMAISWVWILGIMGILDIGFNIVNIILASFIFGQGDDYTIFMTEGCCYEHAYRRKMLASYKSSIILSALIMFIGIGTLIFAKHPALHSLAEVTIVGMFSVVLMAYTLPPIVFNWIVKQDGMVRRRPLTLASLARTWYCGSIWLFQLCVGYLMGLVLWLLGGWSKRKKCMLHKFVTYVHKLDQHIIPGVKYTLRNPHNENFRKPAIIVCNHQSMLDPMCLMALSEKILIVANEHSSGNPITRIMFKWLGFYTICQSNFKAWQDSSLQRDIEIFRQYVKEGYSIAIFPEGMRNPKSSILRYHRGPFYLAHELGMDILPIVIHGMNQIMPVHSFMAHPGTLTVCIDKRISSDDKIWGESYGITTKNVHAYFKKRYFEVCKELENSSYYKQLVIERYMYKGSDILREVKANIRTYQQYFNRIDHIPSDISTIYVTNSGLGEFTLLLALVNPQVHVIAYEDDEDKRKLAIYSAEHIVSNLTYHVQPKVDDAKFHLNDTMYIDLNNIKTSIQ